MTVLARYRNLSTLLIQADEGETEVDAKAFYEEHGINGIIRIQDKDFDSLPEEGLYAHFNLEHAGHVPGKTYGLIRLARHGSYDPETGEETLPLLTVRGMRRALCLEMREELSYESLTDEDFEASLPSIHTAGELKEAILGRYRVSLPNVTPEDLIARGVSRTLLQIQP